MALLLSLWILLVPMVAGAEVSSADLSRLQADKNLGLAALEEGDLAEARRRFEAVRRLAPAETLGWADGAVAAMRAKDLAGAKKLLADASRLAPSDSRVLALEGTLAELEGDNVRAVEAFRKAAASNPKDLASRWSAAKLSGTGPSGKLSIRDLEAALEQSPSNLFLLTRLCEARRQAPDRAAALSACDRMGRAIEARDAKTEKYLGEARAQLASGDGAGASLKYRMVENLLRTTPRFQQARHDVEPGVVGLPLEDWSPSLSARLRSRSRAIPVQFVEKPLPALAGLRGVSAVRAGGKEGRDLVFAGERGLVLAAAREGFRPASPVPGSAARSVAVADVLNSGELDLVTPGALWVPQKEGYRKTEIASGERVVPLDFDSDGDLDLYVSGGSKGDRLLRNNLDGTWTDVTASALPAGVASRWAAVADFDRDGDPDLVLASAGGGLVLLDNLRGGRLAEKPAGLPRSGSFLAVAAGDLNADGRPDLVWTSANRAWVALNRGDGTFLPAVELPAGGTPLLFDFDNDGNLDLFLAGANGSALFRNDGSGAFTRAEGTFPAAVDAEAVDFDGDGDLDLALVAPAGAVTLLENRGGNANGWIDVALEGLPTGSAKVNRFGYGSEVEVKSGELYALATVSRPVTHLGLAGNRRADVLRVVWTNGIPQNAISPPVKTLVREVQQLKGSCPFLYAYDGAHWNFVTDALGKSPAGLLYDGVHQAPADTREWLVVAGGLLRPDSGALKLDFTEELWETVYFDLAGLSAVDHPAGVEIVSNEKMVPPPFPAKSLFTIAHPRTPKATDETGRDRTSEIARADGVYLGGFVPTRYQGIVEPHSLVLELPEARHARKVLLYLTGWIFYSDTSINVSLSQGAGTKPFGPVLEVPDGKGGWRTAIGAMGYPAGKTKTMPVDLSEVLDRRDPRVRIRTNLAIYWDRICYTVDEEPAPVKITTAPLLSATLFYRGFSRMVRETPEGPHVFLHDDVDISPHWADMAGLYTRYGDVRDLLTAADDRYVVLKSGDAVRLEFDARALPDLPRGWVRDYVVVLDGWEKDADKNTVAGQTVEPLPFHGMDDARYGEPSQAYPDDEAHRRFRAEYLTRRAGPEEFLDALKPGNGKRETGNDGRDPRRPR